MSKSIVNWSPDDVGLWVSELGPWSVGYSESFITAGEARLFLPTKPVRFQFIQH